MKAMITKDETVFIAPGAVVLGNVTLGTHSSVWYNATVRGDSAPITIGAGSNVQDGCVLHVDTGYPLHIGENVTVGHGAILHGCTVEDGCLIGMGAILLNGCVVGRGSLVAAGALVTQGSVIPEGSLVIGSPAKVKRALTEEEKQHSLQNAQLYVREAAELLSEVEA